MTDHRLSVDEITQLDLMARRTCDIGDPELVALLRIIRKLALLPYPFPDDARHEPELLLALGQIAGLAGNAIATQPTEGR